MVLRLTDAFVVTKEKPKLLDAWNISVLARVFTRHDFTWKLIFFSVEDSHSLYLFVNSTHEFFQLLKVQFEFLNQIFAALFKV